MMQKLTITAVLALGLAGCATTSYNVDELPTKDTRALCRIVAEHPNQEYKAEAVKLLAKRGATPERCVRLIQADNAMITGIAVAGAAVAVGAAANNGGYYTPRYRAYGVAWDQFQNEYYQTTWRCRDRANGQFVPDYQCSHLAMVDSTWPGW
ncbi:MULTISPECIES: hypothetical protein [Chelativorans]|jgi:hypothetical protein|nr:MULTISPECIES: hypothetical protein [Chelativorans]